MISENKFWYAIYTRSRYERAVYDRLVEGGIEAYLPLVKKLKQWSDRKKWVEEPLFRSYVFVRISEKDHFNVLNTPGVVKYVSFEGKAVKVPQLQILAIKQYINSEDFETENITLFKPGDQVEIFRGSLKGLVGILFSFQGKQKVKIEIESIGHSLLLTIPRSYLKIVTTH